MPGVLVSRVRPKPVSMPANVCISSAICSITCPIQVPRSMREKKPPRVPSEQRWSIIVGNMASIRSRKPSILLVGNCSISCKSSRIWINFLRCTLHILGPRSACIFKISIVPTVCFLYKFIVIVKNKKKLN